MKKLFLTTALVFPLTLAPALVLAQQATVPPPGQSAQDNSTVTDPAAGAASEAADPAQAAGNAIDEAAEEAADMAGEATTDEMDAAADEADAAADAAAQAAAEAEAAADEAAADEAATMAADPDKVVQQQAASELRLDWVTGATVTAPDGETIGTVSDLILDRDSGRMVAAVIGVGGFLGIGEKKIAVPWDRLAIDYDANRITSDLSRAEAEAAPEYLFRDRESLPAPVDAGLPPASPAPIR